MKTLEWFLQILDKLKSAIAYLVGYFVGKKIQRLEYDKQYLNAKEQLLGDTAAKQNKVREKWARRRKSLRVVNPANQPSSVPEEDGEPAISIDSQGAELRPDRE